MPIILQPDIVTADLVSAARAQQNATLSALAGSSPAYFASLVSAASNAIRNECHRDFTVAAYTDYYSGSAGQQVLRLRQFPVVGIDRVATAAPALRVSNDGSTAQRATVATSATGVTLVAVASGASRTTTVLFDTCPTLASLAAAITACGSGWSARTLSGYHGPFELRPAADLKPTQGAVTALGGGTTLEIYEDAGLSGTGDDDWSGLATSRFSAGWRLDPQTGELFGSWPRGQLNIRVDYSAGFAPVPDSVQEACVQLAADLYSQSQLSGAVQSAYLGAAGYTLNTTERTLVRSPKIFALIAPFIAHDRVISHG